jgi:O-antigen/teichoic acid export membrane protein
MRRGAPPPPAFCRNRLGCNGVEAVTPWEGSSREPPVDLRRQLIRNVLSNWAFLFLNFVIFFFLTPYIVSVLGEDRAGIWFLLGSITGYFGIIAFGIPGATEKYVAQFLATGEREQVSRVVSTSLFLSLWIALIAAAGAAALWLNVGRIFRIEPTQLSEAQSVMLIVGIDLALAYPCALMVNVLRGFNRYDVRNAILIPALLIKTGGYFAALSLGAGVTAMVAIQLAVNLLGYLAATLWVFHHAPWLRIRYRLMDRRTYRLLLAYGALQFVGMATDRIILYTDRWILAGVIGTAAVTAYSIAARLSDMGREISAGLDMTLRPTASHLHALGDYAGLRMLLVMGGRVLLVMLGGLYVLYATWGDRFIALWVPKLDAQLIYVCLAILIGPAFLTIVLGPGISIMYGMAKHRPRAVLGVVVAIVNVGLSLWLVYVIGIYGVAIGTVAPLFFIRGLYMYRYLPRITQMDPWRFIAGVWGRPLLGLVPLAGALTALRFVLHFDRLASLMLFFVIAGAVYAGWVYLVVLTPDEKRLVHDVIAGIPFRARRRGADS